MEISLGKKASALIPALMSIVAIFLFSIHVLLHGWHPVRAEGAIAYLYLLLVVAQLPVIALFAYRWFRLAPLQGFPVIATQVVALAAALIPVHLMGW